MISMRLRRLYFLLLYLTGCPRDRRPEMQGLIPLSSRASLNQPEAIVPWSNCPAGQRHRDNHDLSRSHEKA